MFKVTGIHLRTGKRICEQYQYKWLVPDNPNIKGSLWKLDKTTEKWKRIDRYG